VAGASPATREALVRGVPLPWRAKRAENAGRLIAGLHGWDAAEPLFTEWPADAAPLGAVLVFGSDADRDRFRDVLREAGVYCPVHWADAADSSSDRVRQLAARILTIPTDWRYSAADMARTASLLRSG
jgi:malonyl CoA-acyl carrier protein transacylase